LIASSSTALALFLHGSEAFAAVNRTVLTGLERHFGFFAAVGADGIVHLTVGFAGVLACVAAVLAALGLVDEAFLRIELLLAGSEDEIIAAILANQGFVFEHGLFTSL